MLTNTGLVDHAKMALNEKWGYVWGTFGGELTPTVFDQKLKQYPDGVGKYKDFIRDNWLNKRATDCVGLIKSYLWWSNSGPVYTPKQDVSANGMYDAATVKGDIETMPDVPGICLWKPGHIGVYIGNGQVIEAHGTKYGVIQTPLKNGTDWTRWLKCPWISYTEKEVSLRDILHEVSEKNAWDWELAISDIVKKADNGEAPKIFSYLPLLIKNVYKGGK